MDVSAIIFLICLIWFASSIALGAIWVAINLIAELIAQANSAWRHHRPTVGDQIAAQAQQYLQEQDQ